MIFEVPSFSKARKEVFSLLKSEIGAKKVYIYPITDTLVAAFDHPPDPADLVYPKLLKRLFEERQSFLAFGVPRLGDDSSSDVIIAVYRDGKGVVKKRKLPAEVDAILAVINEAGVNEVYYLAGMPHEELINLAVRKAGELLNKECDIAKVSTSITEEDFNDVQVEKSFKEVVYDLYDKHKKAIIRGAVIAVACTLVIASVVAGIRLYKKYKHNAKLRKQSNVVQTFTDADVNMQAYKAVSSLVKDKRVIFVGYSTSSNKVYYVGSHPVDRVVVAGSVFYVAERVIVPVKSRVKPCVLSERVFKELKAYGTFAPLDVVFKLKNVDALEKIFCANAKLNVLMMRDKEGWTVRVSSGMGTVPVAFAEAATNSNAKSTVSSINTHSQSGSNASEESVYIDKGTIGVK